MFSPQLSPVAGQCYLPGSWPVKERENGLEEAQMKAIWGDGDVSFHFPPFNAHLAGSQLPRSPGKHRGSCGPSPCPTATQRECLPAGGALDRVG